MKKTTTLATGRGLFNTVVVVPRKVDELWPWPWVWPWTIGGTGEAGAMGGGMTSTFPRSAEAARATT
jgi:hypothetical protein